MKLLTIPFLVTAIFSGSNESFSLPEIRDCESEYYDITGTDGNELLAEMQTKNDTKDGYFAVTKYSYKSKCSELSLNCKVRLPRWTEFDSSPNQVLRKKWIKFYGALISHHQGHVDILNTDMHSAALESQEMNCPSATSYIKLAFEKMVAAQQSYSQETKHGLARGAVFGGKRYMGIAYSAKPDAIGWAYDVETEDIARHEALRRCKNPACKFVVSAYGEGYCVSVARGRKGGYGYAYGEGREDSETKSVASCSKFDKSCVVRKTVCAGQGPVD